MYCWNAMTSLLKLEGTCWQNEVLLSRQKPLWHIIFMLQSLLILNFCHVICHACAILWDLHIMISCATRVLSFFGFCFLGALVLQLIFLLEQVGWIRWSPEMPSKLNHSVFLAFGDSSRKCPFQEPNNFCIELLHNCFCFHYFCLVICASITSYLLLTHNC